MAKYKQAYVRLPSEYKDVKVEVNSCSLKLHECFQVTSGLHLTLHCSY